MAHSQGTIVALDALAEDDAGDFFKTLDRCDLVTMGSPFHHFYQHYFPNEYPPLSDQKWDRLRQRVEHWYNIFRIDDYVGTAIAPRRGAPGGAESEPDGNWLEDIPVDSEGHTGYWSDRQVLEELDRRQLV